MGRNGGSRKGKREARNGTKMWMEYGRSCDGQQTMIGSNIQAGRDFSSFASRRSIEG